MSAVGDAGGDLARALAQALHKYRTKIRGPGFPKGHPSRRDVDLLIAQTIGPGGKVKDMQARARVHFIQGWAQKYGVRFPNEVRRPLKAFLGYKPWHKSTWDAVADAAVAVASHPAFSAVVGVATAAIPGVGAALAPFAVALQRKVTDMVAKARAGDLKAGDVLRGVAEIAATGVSSASPEMAVQIEKARKVLAVARYQENPTLGGALSKARSLVVRAQSGDQSAVSSIARVAAKARAGSKPHIKSLAYITAVAQGMKDGHVPKSTKADKKKVRPRLVLQYRAATKLAAKKKARLIVAKRKIAALKATGRPEARDEMRDVARDTLRAIRDDVREIKARLSEDLSDTDPSYDDSDGTSVEVDAPMPDEYEWGEDAADYDYEYDREVGAYIKLAKKPRPKIKLYSKRPVIKLPKVTKPKATAKFQLSELKKAKPAIKKALLLGDVDKAKAIAFRANVIAKAKSEDQTDGYDNPDADDAVPEPVQYYQQTPMSLTDAGTIAPDPDEYGYGEDAYLDEDEEEFDDEDFAEDDDFDEEDFDQEAA